MRVLSWLASVTITAIVFEQVVFMHSDSELVRMYHNALDRIRQDVEDSHYQVMKEFLEKHNKLHGG